MNFKDLLSKIVGFKADRDLIDAYRSSIPHDVQLNIRQNGDLYLATITGIEHKPLPEEVFLITEAKTEVELVDMVNDLIFSYKRIPVNYRHFYRQALKPEGSVANSESMSLVKS